MSKLQSLLEASAVHHKHVCPRQVLGVRLGLLAGDVLGIEVPQGKKRLFAFVETDGCGMGGIATASGCFVRRRTMRVMDFGKLAATFVDRENGRAIRIYPHPQSRQRAIAALPDERNRWQSQLKAYQFLPDEALFVVEDVQLTVSLEKIISKPGLCVLCAACGEEISNGREVERNGRVLCRACVGESYYQSALSLAVAPANEYQLQPSNSGRPSFAHGDHFHYRL